MGLRSSARGLWCVRRRRTIVRMTGACLLLLLASNPSALASTDPTSEEAQKEMTEKHGSLYGEWSVGFRNLFLDPALPGIYRTETVKEQSTDPDAEDDGNSEAPKNKDEKTADRKAVRLARGLRRTKYGAWFLDVNEWKEPDDETEETRNELIECDAEPCRPHLRLPGIYPLVQFTNPRVVRARWSRVCSGMFPCKVNKGTEDAPQEVCEPFVNANTNTCPDNGEAHGTIKLRDAELLVRDTQPAWFDVRTGDVINWRMRFKDITGNKLGVPQVIQEAVELVGRQELANAGIEVRMVQTHLWRSRYEMCSLQQNHHGSTLVKRYFEWLYEEQDCDQVTAPCKKPQDELDPSEEIHASTVFTRCVPKIPGGNKCPEDHPQVGMPEKFCDLMYELPDILHGLDPTAGTVTESGETEEAGAVEDSAEDVLNIARTASSLQRFRIHDASETPDTGKLQYRVSRMGIDKFIPHEEMCKISPESVWLFYRYVGAQICDPGPRPCLDRVNSACAAQSSQTDGNGFIDSSDNRPAGGDEDALRCPVGTVGGIEQVCGKDMPPPRIPPGTGIGPDRIQSSSSGAHRRRAAVPGDRSGRHRRRLRRMLQPRPDTSQYDPFPGSNSNCPQLRSVIVQLEGGGATSILAASDTESAARHVARYTGLWDIHRDSGLLMGQLYAASRLPMRMPERTFLAGLDGRATFATAGAAGGEVGELLVALNGLERARAASARAHLATRAAGSSARANLSRDEIRELVRTYVQWLHSSGAQLLYLGTDVASVRRWAAAAGVKPHIVNTPGLIEDALASYDNAQQILPLEVRERMVRIATEPQFVGDSHIRAMLVTPEAYLVRRELVEEVLRTFAGLYLGTMKTADAAPAVETSVLKNMPPVDGSSDALLSAQLVLGILDGYHEETGLLRVYDPPVSLCGGASPLIVPSSHHPKSSFYVLHPSAVSARRAQLARFMAIHANPPSTDYSASAKRPAEIKNAVDEQMRVAVEEMPITESDVLRHMLQIGTHQLKVTLDNIVSRKGPTYDVFFSNGEYTVTDSSLIPASVFSS